MLSRPSAASKRFRQPRGNLETLARRGPTKESLASSFHQSRAPSTGSVDTTGKGWKRTAGVFGTPRNRPRKRTPEVGPRRKGRRQPSWREKAAENPRWRPSRLVGARRQGRRQTAAGIGARDRWRWKTSKRLGAFENPARKRRFLRGATGPSQAAAFFGPFRRAPTTKEAFPGRFSGALTAREVGRPALVVGIVFAGSLPGQSGRRPKVPRTLPRLFPSKRKRPWKTSRTDFKKRQLAWKGEKDHARVSCPSIAG